MSLDEARVAEYKGTHLCWVNFRAKELSISIARLAEREQTIRESWVRAMEARIVQTNLQKCYRIEGTNNLETCKHLADRYTEMLKENRVRVLRLASVSARPDTYRIPAGPGLQAHRYLNRDSSRTSPMSARTFAYIQHANKSHYITSLHIRNI